MIGLLIRQHLVRGLSFGLPATLHPQFAFSEVVSIWLAQAWIPTFSYLLILQAAIGRLPEARNFAVLALPIIGAPAVLVLVSGCVLSIAGIVVRLMDSANEWQILFYRSLSLIATLLLVLALRNRGRVLQAFRVAGMTGVAGGLFLSLAFTGFIFSLTHTTVANSLFLLSVSPFMAAALAWRSASQAATRPARRAVTVALAPPWTSRMASQSASAWRANGRSRQPKPSAIRAGARYVAKARNRLQGLGNTRNPSPADKGISKASVPATSATRAAK
ncbi:MAG: hypothetical protein IH786_06365 [Proteobacteria bacterium]|nr:hypothetical protein [Pseudomonadota bacterium]